MAHAGPDRAPGGDPQPGRPRWEIWDLPARVAEVFSVGFSPACLTTDRAAANRDRSPVSAKMTAASTADSP
jgi:hypothetical protein